MLLIPLFNGIKALIGIVNAPPAPPSFAPPAPPPPPAQPALVTQLSVAMFDFAENNPVTYLLIDLVLFLLVAIFFLYLKDINDWIEAREQARRQAEAGGGPMAAGPSAGYQKLAEEEEEDVLLEFDSVQVKTAADLAKELRVVADRCYELEVRLRVHKKAVAAGTAWALALRDELNERQERRDSLRHILGEANANSHEPSDAAKSGSAGGANDAGPNDSDLQRLFSTFDKDGSGQLEHTELSKVFTALGLEATPQQVSSLLRRCTSEARTANTDCVLTAY